MLEIDKIHVNTEQAISILQRNTDSFGTFFDLERLLDYYAYDTNMYDKEIEKFFLMAGTRNIAITKDQMIIYNMIERFNLSEDYFKDNSYGGSSKLSIKDSIRTSMLEDPTLSEDVKEYIKSYDRCRGYLKDISYLDQYMKLPISRKESYEGHRMVVAHPQWGILNTGRIGASVPSVQNIPKNRKDIQTCPKGWILTFADSSQIEPKNVYSTIFQDPLIIALINLYKDAYYGATHYALLTNEQDKNLRELLAHGGSLDDTYKMDFSKFNRDHIKKINNACMYGSALQGNFEPSLVAGFKERIANHPLRLKRVAEVDAQVNRGDFTFYTGFGSPITPKRIGKWLTKSESEWISHVRRCGINNPIQGTAADLLDEAIYQADKLFLTKAKNRCYIGSTVHDEMCTYIHEDDADLVEEVTGLTSYKVKGWLPIYNDVHIGRKDGDEKVKVF